MHLRAVIGALVLFCWSLAVSADQLLDKAARLINSHHGKEAYQLLLPEVDARAGKPDFDLLLGIAALDAGRPTEAVFALERVLAVQPNNQRAKMEMARAYYDAGENEASKQEFNSVHKSQLPPDVQKTIDKYLAAIDTRISNQKRQINFYIAGSAGYDSNVNAATDSSTVAIPAFGNLVFTLDNTSRHLDSGFYSINAGASFNMAVPQHETLRIFGAANMFYRPAWNEHRFDTAAGDAQVGAAYTSGDDTYMGSVVGQSYLIDNKVNRNQGGISVQWLHMFGDDTRGTVFGQGLIQRFPDQPVRNVTQYAGGVGVVHLFQMSGRPVLYASLFGGADLALDLTRPDIGRKFVGVRMGGQYTLLKNLDLVGGVSYQYSRYGAKDPLFLRRRLDNFVFVHAGVQFTYHKHWVFQPEVQYIRNGSTLPINDFKRWQMFATARYNF